MSCKQLIWTFLAVERLGGDTMKARIARLQKHVKEWYPQSKYVSRVQSQTTVDTLRSERSWPEEKSEGGDAALGSMCAHASPRAYGRIRVTRRLLVVHTHPARVHVSLRGGTRTIYLYWA